MDVRLVAQILTDAINRFGNKGANWRTGMLVDGDTKVSGTFTAGCALGGIEGFSENYHHTIHNLIDPKCPTCLAIYALALEVDPDLDENDYDGKLYTTDCEDAIVDWNDDSVKGYSEVRAKFQAVADKLNYAALVDTNYTMTDIARVLAQAVSIPEL